MAVKPVPEGYPTVTPYLVVDGAAEAIDFYASMFGATERMRMPGPDNSVGHAELAIGESVIMLSDHYPDMGYLGPKDIGGTPVTIMVYVPDVDDVFERALAAGAKGDPPRREPVLRRPIGTVRRSVRPPVERLDPRRGRPTRRDGEARWPRPPKPKGTDEPTDHRAALPSPRGHPAVRWPHGHRDGGRLRCRPAPRP